MGATTQLAAGANVQNAHGLAVLLAKQHHGAGFLGAFNVHHTRLRCGVGQNFGVDLGLDLADLDIRHRRVVRKVKTGALRRHQAALLLHMAAQHFAQGFVHQVGGGVVAHGGGTQAQVHMRLHRIAHLEAARFDFAVVTKHIGTELERVGHMELAACAVQQALVAHLAARLGVKRGRVQHHHARLASFQLGHGSAIGVQGQHFGVGRQCVVAHKVAARARIVERLVHLELARRAGLGFLLFHGRGKTGFIHRQATLTAHVGRQIERKAIGVVQLERHLTGQHFHTTIEGSVQNLHAALQRFKKALFFHT